MDTLKDLSDQYAALSAKATAKVFHVPSPLGGRTALGFDGKRLLVPASDASTGETLTVIAPGGAEVPARVAGFDPGLDLAVLELADPIAGTGWTRADGIAALGSLVLVAAYPSPEGPEVRLDVLRFSGGEGESAYLQTDGSPFPGFAGAALVDVAGDLLGFQLSSRGGNRGWAIPASRAAVLIDAIGSGRSGARAWLGVSTVPVAVPADLAEGFGDGRETALLVSGVQEDSPAGKAGLRVGDILVSAGGKPLADGEDLIDALRSAKPGEELPIVFFRAGQRIEAIAIPEERTENGRSQGSRWARYGRGARGPWWMGGGRCGWGPGR